MSKPILWIVIPCYNEEAVLPITAPLFLQKINDLAARGLVSDRSRVLFVNDGSKDKTWELIQGFAKQDEHFIGIAQSRNRGHQNAVLAGLMEALHSGSCDITISIDCDGHLLSQPSLSQLQHRSCGFYPHSGLGCSSRQKVEVLS